MPEQFILTTPWLTFKFEVAEDDITRADQIAKKISDKNLSADDVLELNWFFASLAGYPFAYILPRSEIELQDQHKIKESLSSETPTVLLRNLAKGLTPENCLAHVAATSLSAEWTWDSQAALEFSQMQSGYDPESLFSISRRFHLLNDIENNKTAELLQFIKTLESNKEKFRETSALIMRQNHYITEKCEPVLSASLELAKTAKDEVKSFIRAESGHDKILEKALRALGAEPQQVYVLECVTVLMDLFKYIGQRNFLAFSMVVDIFERTSYHDQDPFAKALKDGGEAKAANQISVHREINDLGGHENVAIGFLKDMGPVSADYAIEALRMSELVTQVIHSISKDTLFKINS